MGKNAKYFSYTEILSGPPSLSFGSFEDEYTPKDEGRVILRETLVSFISIIKKIRKKEQE